MKRIDPSRARVPGTNLEGWRAIAVGVLALYVLLFIVLNNRRLDLNFVFFKIRSHELLALIMILLIGFAAGFIVGARRQRSRSGPPSPEMLQAGSEATGHGDGQSGSG